MARFFLAAAALFALAACASSDQPPPAAPAPPPPAPTFEAAPAPASVAAPGVVAPGVAAPATPAPPPPRGDIVVPGQVERTLPPAGDPRSVSERMEDIRAWDDCIMRSQGMGESDPMRPQLDPPEEICRRALDMASRTAVPASRRR